MDGIGEKLLEAVKRHYEIYERWVDELENRLTKLETEAHNG